MRLPFVASSCLALAVALVLGACADDTTESGSPDPMTDAAADPTPDPSADPTIGPVPAGETVASVAVPQYLGTWYEIARIPQGFQRNCAATTATYEPIDATTVKVINRCRVGGLDGDPVDITGTATIVDTGSNAKLEVDFGFARAPYWIVDLAIASGAEPYPWAIVSNPDRSALWILSRTPVMPPARYDALIARLTQRGYQPERLERTAQPQ